MLLGAVHFLLLGGVDHPVRGFYPTLGGKERPENAYPLFREFVLTHQASIIPILEQRLVQTNEVARSSVLLPAYHLVAEEADQELAVIEFGTSAGLNLIFDRYHHTFDPGPSLGPAGSGVHLQCAVRGQGLPDLAMPTVTWRRGLDLNPLDVTNESNARWLEALTWPDEGDRVARLRTAIAEFKTDPPRLDRGGLEQLSTTIADVPADHALCLSHSLMLHQLAPADREAIHEILIEAGRPAYRVAFEFDRDRDGWWLELTMYEGGTCRSTNLAEAHSHGAWIRWVDDGPS